jgi:hypothetical protein
VDVEATDTASTTPSIDVTNSEANGRRDTMLAIGSMANVTLQPMKPLGDSFTTTSSPNKLQPYERLAKSLSSRLVPS